MQQSPRLSPSLAVCGALACALAFGSTSGERAGAQSPPPPPPPVGPSATARPSATPAPAPSATATATASPSPEPRGRRGRNRPAPAESSGPEPSPTPTSPAFATLDGTWELQLQYIDRTEYSYLTLAQGASGTLTGTWKVNNKPFPLEGTYDGRLIKMVVKEPTGDVTMSGYVEGASDMVGTVDLTHGKTDPTAFTAEHRPSSKGSVFKKGV